MRAVEMLCAVANAIQTNPTLLPSMRGVWSGDTKETRKASRILRAVMQDYGRAMAVGTIPVPAVLTYGGYQGSVSTQRQRYALDVQNAQDEGLLRAAWVCAYWHFSEFKNLRDFGFPY